MQHLLQQPEHRAVVCERQQWRRLVGVQQRQHGGDLSGGPRRGSGAVGCEPAVCERVDHLAAQRLLPICTARPLGAVAPVQSGNRWTLAQKKLEYKKTQDAQQCDHCWT